MCIKFSGFKLTINLNWNLEMLNGASRNKPELIRYNGGAEKCFPLSVSWKSPGGGERAGVDGASGRERRRRRMQAVAQCACVSPPPPPATESVATGKLLLVRRK